MKTKIYRLSWNLNTTGYTKNVNEIIVTETKKTYKVLEGNSGWASLVNKNKLGVIHSGIIHGESLSGFHYEVFCLEEDIDHLKKELDKKIESSFNQNYHKFQLMKNALNN